MFGTPNNVPFIYRIQGLRKFFLAWLPMMGFTLLLFCLTIRESKGTILDNIVAALLIAAECFAAIYGWYCWSLWVKIDRDNLLLKEAIFRRPTHLLRSEICEVVKKDDGWIVSTPSDSIFLPLDLDSLDDLIRAIIYLTNHECYTP